MNWMKYTECMNYISCRIQVGVSVAKLSALLGVKRADVDEWEQVMLPHPDRERSDAPLAHVRRIYELFDEIATEADRFRMSLRR